MLTITYLEIDIVHQLEVDLKLKQRPWPESSFNVEYVFTLVLLSRFRTGVFGGCWLFCFTS